MAGLTTTRRSSPLAGPAGVALFLRRLRAERLLALVLAVVVLLTALLFAAVPRFYNAIADEGARHAIRDADTPIANVQMLEQRLQLTGQSTYSTQDAAAHGSELQADLPPALSSLFSSSDYVAQSAEFAIARQPGAAEWPKYFIRMRYQSALADHVRVLDGRLPKATDETVTLPDVDETGKQIEVEVPVVEVAVAADALETAKMHVGERLDATLSQDSQVFIGGLVRTEDASDRVVAEIVGSFEPSQADEPYWYGDVLPLRANITGSVDQPLVHVVGLMADQGLDRMAGRESVAFEYRWQYFVDPERLDAGSLDAVNAAV